MLHVLPLFFAGLVVGCGNREFESDGRLISRVLAFS
jgi:hypothetical protein